jgi:hypothetical protein
VLVDGLVDDLVQSAGIIGIALSAPDVARAETDQVLVDGLVDDLVRAAAAIGIVLSAPTSLAQRPTRCWSSDCRRPVRPAAVIGSR